MRSAAVVCPASKCGFSHAAGLYGVRRSGPNRPGELVARGHILVFLISALRPYSLTRPSPFPHPGDTRHVGGILRPSLPPSDLGNFLFLSSWPKPPLPSCWPAPLRQEYVACASAFVRATCSRMSPGAQPSLRLTWLR